MCVFYAIPVNELIEAEIFKTLALVAFRRLPASRFRRLVSRRDVLLGTTALGLNTGYLPSREGLLTQLTQHRIDDTLNWLLVHGCHLNQRRWMGRPRGR